MPTWRAHLRTLAVVRCLHLPRLAREGREVKVFAVQILVASCSRVHSREQTAAGICGRLWLDLGLGLLPFETASDTSGHR